MLNLKKSSILLLLSLLFLNGCIDLMEQAVRYNQVIEARQYLKKFIGLSKEEVRAELGEPDSIKTPESSNSLKIDCDQVWKYFFPKGKLVVYSLYFKEERVVETQAH